VLGLVTGSRRASVSGRQRLLLYLAFLAALSVVGFIASRERLPDNRFYIQASERMITPGCAEIHCFRVLVPWTIGALPGNWLVKWKAYAVVCNAAAALAVFDLCLFFGLSMRASVIAGALTAFGFSSFGTLWQPYQSDPLMFWLAPLVLRWTLEGRMARVSLVASIGVLAKEFAVVPFAIAGIADARDGNWRRASRAAAAGAAAFAVWLALQLVLRLQYGYSFGPNLSPKFLQGSYLVFWLGQMSARGALSAMFNEFGPIWLLFPLGWIAAPRELRRIIVAALPIAALYAYLQQPDRALWNFHFLTSPLAALVLESMSTLFVGVFLAVYAFAYLKVGAEVSFVPHARYAYAVGIAMALAAVVSFVRSRRATAVVQPS
jgi:hypothetical protein